MVRGSPSFWLVFFLTDFKKKRKLLCSFVWLFYYRNLTGLLNKVTFSTTMSDTRNIFVLKLKKPLDTKKLLYSWLKWKNNSSAITLNREDEMVCRFWLVDYNNKISKNLKMKFEIKGVTFFSTLQSRILLCAFGFT